MNVYRKLTVLTMATFFTLTSFAQLLSNRQPVTKDMIMTWQLMDITSEVDIYLSDAVEIQREVEKDPTIDYKALMDQGKIKIEGGKIYEIVRFVSNGAGMIEYIKDNEVAVRFEHGEGLILVFEAQDPSGPEQVQYYKLKMRSDDTGKYIQYADGEFQVILGTYIILEYKSKNKAGAQQDKRKVRGLNRDGSEKQGLFGN